jgi:hypothetical protein
MEAALRQCKRLAARRLGLIINAGGNPVQWFYEIRDSNQAVAASGKDFDTRKAAMAAGRKKARELKASDSLPKAMCTVIGPPVIFADETCQ